MKTHKMKELIVNALDNGTVIDHIPSASLMQVARILKLDDSSSTVIMGMNLESSKMSSKGLIKVKDTYFQPQEINKISLVAPQATLTIIENYDVKEKRIVEVPDEVVGLIQCPNPKCITNHEIVTTHFHVINKVPTLKLQCHYCEKVIGKEDLKFF